MLAEAKEMLEADDFNKTKMLELLNDIETAVMQFEQLQLTPASEEVAA